MNVSQSLAGPQLSGDMVYLVNAVYCSLETVNTLQKLEPAVITEKQDRPCTALKVCKHLQAHIVFTSKLSVTAV